MSELAARLAQAVKGLRRDSAITESLEEVIEESEREAKELSSQERLMLANLLKFGELAVSDVMVPRADIVAVEAETSLPELIALFREAQHSRLPIYRETLDDPLGMIHIKDVLAAAEVGADGQLRWPHMSITKMKRDVLFVPGAMPALDLLLKMQATHKHLALVVDEYGGTDGLVSIEDLVEVIVGEIDDEHDVEEKPLIAARADGGYDADARTSLEEFNDRTGLDLAAAESDEEVNTLGGLVVAALGRVPARGEIVTVSGVEIEVLEADPRRVKRLRIRSRSPIPATAAP
ncbi:MAG TPA: hemolysin family protein [Micropepsaceae bacterium]|nr:hemolysin family protein [Micropepsaceae bacterium]